MQQRFAHWLQPAFGDFTLDYDVDRIDALSSEREKDWARLGAASFLTDDEKREAVGYGRMPRGRKDDFAAVDAGNAELGDGSGDGEGGGGSWQNQPRVPAGNEDGGQWTAGGGGAQTIEGATATADTNQTSEDASLSAMNESCADEWRIASDRCEEWLSLPSPPLRLTGGYKDTYNCARGLVSQRCGGNAVSFKA